MKARSDDKDERRGRAEGDERDVEISKTSETRKTRETRDGNDAVESQRNRGIEEESRMKNIEAVRDFQGTQPLLSAILCVEQCITASCV